jgi:hypothetical protein
MLDSPIAALLAGNPGTPLAEFFKNGLFGAGRPVQDWMAQRNAAAQTAYGETLKRTANPDRAGAAMVHALAGNPAENPIVGGWGPADLGAVAGIIKAYHGSPHSFDKFSMSQIGTGEGAQAYGHGLYFAENPATAQAYREKLSPGRGGDGADIAARLLKNLSVDDAIAEIKDRIASLERRRVENPRSVPPEYLTGRAPLHDALDVLESGKNVHGTTYEVELAPNKEDLLDWDKPLSQQSEKVRAAVKKLADEKLAPGAWEQLKDKPGSYFYEYALAGGDRWSQSHASFNLLDYGIPGIKYLDQGSRGADEGGTHNFVMFDDELVKITGRK